MILSLFLYIRAFIFFIVISPIMIISSLLFPNSIYPFGRFISKGVFKCFNISFDIKGKFPTKGPYILMHNHTSFLDLFLLPTIIDGKFTGVVAAKNFKIPIIGMVLRRINAIPIYRSDRQKAIKSIQKAESLIKKGFHIAIFPEGTRSIDGKLGQFKKGGFHMAVNTATPILPIVVHGLFEIKPKTRWTLHPGKVTMAIHKPIISKNKTVNTLLNETLDIFKQSNL